MTKDSIGETSKHGFADIITPAGVYENGSSLPQRRQFPSWLQVRPLLGVIALMIAAGAMLASLGILVSSNGDEVLSWPVQPSVYLAVASAIGTACVRFAKARGGPVSWWRNAVHGSTVRELENEWEASQGWQILSATTRFHYAPRMSLATLMALVMIIDGALLQRATSVRQTIIIKEVELSLLLAPELPHGFSGTEQANHMLNTVGATRVYSDFTDNVPMFTNYTGCDKDSTCSSKVSAPGVLSTNCDSRTWAITPEMMHSGNATWGQFHEITNNSNTFNSDTLTGMGAALSMDNPIFNIELYVMTTDHARSVPEGTGVLTGIAHWVNNNGSYTLRECVLRPAILEYAVQFQAGRIIPPSSMTDARFIAWANNTQRFSTNTTSPTERHLTTMDAFSTFLSTIINANATAGFSTPAPPGEVWVPDSSTFNQYADQFMQFEEGAANSLVFTDPLPDVIGKMNNLMFRGALLAGRKWRNVTGLLDSGLSVNQTVIGTQRTNANVFQTAFGWFAGAAALDVLAILLVLQLFWGWWQFPKRLTESPFEMALAFDSPLFSDVDSRGGIGAILRKHGDDEIDYCMSAQAGSLRHEPLVKRVGFEWSSGADQVR